MSKLVLQAGRQARFMADSEFVKAYAEAAVVYSGIETVIPARAVAPPRQETLADRLGAVRKGYGGAVLGGRVFLVYGGLKTHPTDADESYRIL